MASFIRLNNGSARDAKTRYRSYGTEPACKTINANPGESLGSLASRGYGANTAENREKIVRANATLDGQIRIPK